MTSARAHLARTTPLGNALKHIRWLSGRAKLIILALAILTVALSGLSFFWVLQCRFFIYQSDCRESHLDIFCRLVGGKITVGIWRVYQIAPVPPELTISKVAFYHFPYQLAETLDNPSRFFPRLSFRDAIGFEALDEKVRLEPTDPDLTRLFLERTCPVVVQKTGAGFHAPLWLVAMLLTSLAIPISWRMYKQKGVKRGRS